MNDIIFPAPRAYLLSGTDEHGQPIVEVADDLSDLFPDEERVALYDEQQVRNMIAVAGRREASRILNEAAAQMNVPEAPFNLKEAYKSGARALINQVNNLLKE